jgi:hypothetical protein
MASTAMDFVHCHLNRKLPSPLGAIIRQYAGSYVKFRQKQIREVLSEKVVHYIMEAYAEWRTYSLFIEVYEHEGCICHYVRHLNTYGSNSPITYWGTTLIRENGEAVLKVEA